jgi:hypothetical protein
MRGVYPALFTLALALAAPAARAQQIGARPVDPGTPVVLVGEITSEPRRILFRHEGKMQVAVGPEKTDHTLHLAGAEPYDELQQEIAPRDLRDKWWVRASGTLMRDPRRIRVERLEVLGRTWQSYRESAHWQPGLERGYVLAVAGVRYSLPDVRVQPTTRPYRPGDRVVVVAPISSQPRNAGVVAEKKMQVAIGRQRTDYTLHLEGARMMGLDGAALSPRDLRDRMWVRAEGRVMQDARRIEVDSLQVMAPDSEPTGEDADLRPDVEYGYVLPR